ncbi:SOS response-associated peptidase family protein [Mesorhizobium caraganae]|uniref:SOS response-associated peptidase family protein n=1 Tax=Mesorhizobium caraganae TaxID=483206 RepID=UPI003EB8422F
MFGLSIPGLAPFAPLTLSPPLEEYADKTTGEFIRTFAVATCEPNGLMTTIHHRMPVIFAPDDHMRWLGPEQDPHDVMKPFPSDLMTMWPIDSKVGKPRSSPPRSQL